MNAKHLGTYVNDHLAGSVAAGELLDHLISANAGTPRGRFFIELRQEIEQDQAALHIYWNSSISKKSRCAKQRHGFSKKFARAKLSMEDPTGDKLARLEKLEALTLGIEGKRALWRSLNVIADPAPALQAMDLTSLEQRAAEQRQRVEAFRLDAAREAFDG
jgi:hypothetical protein